MTYPQRFQRKRCRGWIKPPGSRCVTRPGVFGNPFTLDDARAAGYAENPKRDAKLMFSRWLDGTKYSNLHQQRRARLLARLPELRGCDLGCYCALSDSCHADVLIYWANLPDGKIRRPFLTVALAV